MSRPALRPQFDTADLLPDGQVFTPEEVAKALRLGRSTVYELVHAGELEGFNVRRCVRITRRSVEAYLEQQRLGPRR